MIKKHVVFLLICLFSLVELFSYADIIYLEKETLIGWFSIIEDRDIVYLKDGGIIKGRLIERNPEQVKIKVISESTIETEKESVSRQKKVDSIIFASTLTKFNASSDLFFSKTVFLISTLVS